jgi:hypothetical protein
MIAEPIVVVILAYQSNQYNSNILHLGAIDKIIIHLSSFQKLVTFLLS